MVSRALVDQAIRAVEARHIEITEELAQLAIDVPGDPATYRWPRYLEDAFQRLYEERESLDRQVEMLRMVLRRAVAW